MTLDADMLRQALIDSLLDIAPEVGLARAARLHDGPSQLEVAELVRATERGRHGHASLDARVALVEDVSHSLERGAFEARSLVGRSGRATELHEPVAPPDARVFEEAPSAREVAHERVAKAQRAI